MSTYKKRQDFFTSSEGILAAQVLRDMVSDNTYITPPSFSANTEQYPDNLIPFFDKHMFYMRDHPSTDPQQYISNLRIMTRANR